MGREKGWALELTSVEGSVEQSGQVMGKALELMTAPEMPPSELWSVPRYL